MPRWTLLAIISAASIGLGCDDDEPTAASEEIAEIDVSPDSEPVENAPLEHEPQRQREPDPEPEPDDLRSIHERALQTAAARAEFAVLVEAGDSKVAMEFISEGYAYPRTRTELVPEAWLKGEPHRSVVFAQWGDADSIERTSTFIELERGRRYVVFGKAESVQDGTLVLLPSLVADADPERPTHPDVDEIREIVAHETEANR